MTWPTPEPVRNDTDATPTVGSLAPEQNADQVAIDGIITAGEALDAREAADAASNAAVAAAALPSSTVPLPTLIEAFAGITIQPGAWRRWQYSTNQIINICCVGDSTTQGTDSGVNTDSWPRRLARILGDHMGPLVGYGFRGMWLGLAAGNSAGTEWATGRTIPGCSIGPTGSNFVIAPGNAANTFFAADVGSVITGPGIPNGTTITGVTNQANPGDTAILSVNPTPGTGAVSLASDVAWSVTTATSAFDVAPFSQCYYPASSPTRATCLTWTKPAWMTGAIVAFDILWADGTSGGAGWQWSTDGVTWNTMPNASARTGSNLLKSSRILSPIPTRLMIRASNNGTANPIAAVGIIPYLLNPNTATGVHVHNLGMDAQTLHGLVHAGSGDSLAILDNGSTHPAGLNPPLVIGCFTNDITDINNTTTWATDLGTFDTRVSGYADVAWWNAFDQSFRNSANEAAYRAKTKTVAASLGWGLLDIYDAWAVMLGVAGWTAANNAGLMYNSLHESQAGHNDIAARWRRALEAFS